MHNQGMNSSAVVRKEKTMDDLISRQMALTALAEAMPSLTTPDGCGQFDHDIQVTDEAYVDCIRIIHDLSPAESGWIPCKTALPQEDGEYLVTIHWKNGGYYTDLLRYRAYLKEWKYEDEIFGTVVAWQPKPAPYQEEGQDG